MSQGPSSASSASAASSAVHSSQGAPEPADIGWADIPRVAASGFAMGSADVVPGVSGGTMAVACGIYHELLAAIASADVLALKALLRFRLKEAFSRLHSTFLISLLSGIAVAVLVMIVIVDLPGLLQRHPREVYAVFFGLVLASVFVLGKQVIWMSASVVGIIAGTLFGFGVVNLVPVDTPTSPVFMFGYGVVAISAMLLPGISGSFILLILGQYEHVIGSLKDLLHGDLAALAIVVPFALGCLFGVVAFSRLVAWLLRRFYHPVMAGLCGLLLGSLWRIWPYQHTVSQEVHGKLKVVEATPYLPESFDLGTWGLLVLGFAVVFAVEFAASLRGNANSSAT